MDGQLRYGDDFISYRVRRQPGRHARRVAIHVEFDGRVFVDASPEAAEADIRRAVTARARWIWTHVGEARRRLAQVLPREYVSGESLLYLGRRYRLRISVDAAGTAVALKGGYLEVRLAERDPARARAALLAWYRTRAKDVFAARLEHIAAELPWLRQPPPLRLQAMRVQWGSCSPAGRLTLNPLLVRAPRDCIDYVLLHELCHLRHHDHSPRFYRLLDAHMAGWRQVKARLDGMAEAMLNV
jgi:predicted metal-dependent hydrolase